MRRVSALLCLVVVLAGCRDAAQPTDTAVLSPTTSLVATSGAVYEAIDLGSFGGRYTSPPCCILRHLINEAGQVIGTSTTPDDNGIGHAFLWEDGVLTNLSTWGGCLASRAYGINELGQVAGWCARDGMALAAVWFDGAMTDLGTLGGRSSVAVAINDAGQVAGVSYAGDATSTVEHAFFWDAGVMTDLGTLGGVESQPFDINAAGQVIGGWTTADGDFRAFVWDAGAMTDLGTLGGTFARAYAINDAGQVVGRSAPAAGVAGGAFLWDGGVMMNLGTLGGTSSSANDINATGQVVGTSWTSGSSTDVHGFIWEADVMTDLGTLGGASVAWAINDAGQVVGWSRIIGTPDPNHPTVDHAFLWENGVMTDLGTLEGDHTSRALALNGRGQVVGTSVGTFGTTRTVLWRPLQPEEVLEAVQAELDALAAAGEIPAGSIAGLSNFIKVATAMLNDGNTAAAVRQLEAFVAAVDRLVRAGTLDALSGETLQAAANGTIAQLD